MTYLCPTCRLALDDAWTCANGHAFEESNGILVLMDPDFAAHFDVFREPFERMRADIAMQLLDPTIYERLPDTPPGHPAHEWRLRRYDLAVLRRLLRDRPRQKVLDVGAWNGWLSNRLAGDGHDVTAIDYFVDPHDGLGAHRKHANRWRSIQMDLEELSILAGPFDLIIFNRCTQYFSDPRVSLIQARGLLGPGGRLVCTGLAFLRDPSQRIATLEESRRVRLQYGIDQFKLTRGYLDFDDKNQLEALGVQLRPYWRLLPATLKSMVRKSSPRYYYGVLSDGRSTRS